MFFRAVGRRCAFDPGTIAPLLLEDAQRVLEQQGCPLLQVNLVTIARSLIGTSRYSRGALFERAPTLLDCSALTKWLYAQRGIWIPRLCVQQIECGEEVSLDALTGGDLLFATGSWNDVSAKVPLGVGHVGFVTENARVIHASSEMGGVLECSLDEFFSGRAFRNTRRLIPKGVRIQTYFTPQNLEIETSDDLTWIIRRSLAR